MTVDDLCSRVYTLDVAVGEVSNNGLGVRDGLEKLRCDLQAIMDKHGGSIDKLHHFLVSYNSQRAFGPGLSSMEENLMIWFETHHEEIRGVIDDLVSLDVVIGGQMESIFEPFVERVPDAIIELSRLHHVTNIMIQLVLKSYTLLRRFVLFSIKQEDFLLETQTRINRINGALRQLETERLL